MIRKKLFQALLSTAVCTTMVLSSVTSVFAVGAPGTPEKLLRNGTGNIVPTTDQAVNLVLTTDAAVSTTFYTYGADAQYNMSRFDLLGSSAYSYDNDCSKLTDGIKSVGGSIDLDNAVNFYSRSAFNTPENGAQFSNKNTIDFDLGTPRTIFEVNTYSADALTGRFSGTLGHIGKYSVYVSSDKTNWVPVLEQKNCANDRSDETGAYVASYSVEKDLVPGVPDAAGIFAQYVRIVFEPTEAYGNFVYVIAEEVEIMGQEGRIANAYEPPSAPEAENLALDATYEYSKSTTAHMPTSQSGGIYSPDTDRTKLNDGAQGDPTGTDLSNWTVFDPIPWMNPDNASNYNNDPLCAIFDLGESKSVTSVLTSSLVTEDIKQSANLQIYVSNDNLEWFEISKKNGYDQVSPTDGVVSLSWDIKSDSIADQEDATAVYARYIKVVFSSVSPDALTQYVALDEIEIFGFSGKIEGAYEPKGDVIIGDEDPNYPDNLAYGKSYEVLNSDAAGDTPYPDPKKTKFTDGIEATSDYLDPAWVGFSAGAYREIVINLGELCSVSQVEFNNLYNLGISAKMPGTVDVSFSKDNANWSTLKNSFPIPEAPTGIEKVLYNWKAAEDPDVIDAGGKDTAKVVAQYVKLRIPMQNWCFIDEIRVRGEKGVATDAVTLPTDDEVVRTYMQKGEHTGDIGHLVLLYNGYYDNGSGDWTAENCLPYLIHEDPETGDLDTMFDGVLMLALRTPGGQHTFQGPSSAAEAATVEDFIWYLNKTLGEGGDIAALNEAAKIAGEKLGDPNYKMKVVLNIPGTSEKQVDFGALPGTTKSLSFSPDTNPDGYMDDQVAALEWYNSELLRMWNEGGFDYLDLVGIYLVEEGINRMTPALQSISDFADANDLKYFWIPYMNAAGYSQWRRWGFDAVAYQPNYTFSSDPTTARLKNAATAAIEYGMGIELELSGLNESGVISPDKFNRYMDYLEAGVDYGFDGDKSYKAYYQDTCALLYAANSTNPKVRYIYDATYEFIKGTYQKGYLQYLENDTITLNDVSDINTALDAIEQKLTEAADEELAYLNGQKSKLEAFRDYVMAIRDDIADLNASFEGVTADNITAGQKVELAETVAKVRSYLNGKNLTDSQRSTLTKKLDMLIALDPAAYPQYTVSIGSFSHGKVTADKSKALEGDIVTLTVIPDEYYKLKEGSLKVNGVAVSGNTFIMPAKNVTVTAGFETVIPIMPPISGGNNTVYVSGGATAGSTAPATVDTQAVISELKDSPKSVITVRLSRGVVVEPSVFAAAQASGKNIIFEVEDSAGALLYQWEFNGANIAYPDIATSLGILMSDLVQSPEMKELSGLNTGMVIDFLHAGTLPGAAQVAIRVSDQYEDGTLLYFYSLNPSSGKLELAGKNLPVKGGYVVLPNCAYGSECLLSEQAIAGVENSSGNNGSGWASSGSTKNPATGDSSPIGLAVMMLASGAALLALRKKEK